LFQDTPAIKFPYTAVVRHEEIYSPYMSAYKLVSESKPGETHFSLDFPIPSYLVSICVGVLSEKKVSERCAVIAEPSYLETCALEFEDTEKYLLVAE
jgi:leukotriene-A4 hydrolase